MENNSKDIYLNCKKSIERGDYERFAKLFSQLIQASTDENFNEILRDNLNSKLENDCIQIKADAINLRQFDSIEISSLYEKYRIIKQAFEHCNAYIDQSGLFKVDSNNRKRVIENEIGMLVKDNFMSFISNKTIESVLDESQKNTLNFLIGYSFIEEISENVSNFLNELEIDNEDQLFLKMTNSILDKGLGALKEYEDEIPAKDFRELEKKIKQLFKIEQDYENQTANEIISSILKELKIKDKDGLHDKIIKSVMSRGFDCLNEFTDSISKKNLNKLQERLSVLFLTHDKEKVKTNEEKTSKESKILEILKEIKIKDENRLHARVVDSVLKNSTRNLYTFEYDIPKIKLSTLEKKLNDTFDLDLNNKKKGENSRNENEIILEILNEVEIKNENNLHEKIIKSILENDISAIKEHKDDISLNKYAQLEEKLKKHLNSKLNNEEKVDLVILNILKECKIEDEDDIHKKIVAGVKENGNKSVENFKDFISGKQRTLLEVKLKSNEFLIEFFDQKTPKLDLKNEIFLSRSKFKIKNKINLTEFNSMEGYLKPVDEIIKEICQNDHNFAESIFSLMVYLIKRQQSLKFFIKELNFRLEEKQLKQFSLKELIYNLFLNAEDDVRIKIFQLLHSTNPVPLVGYFVTCENTIEPRFYSETYWLNEGLNNKKLLSFSFDSTCKGKTRLINSIFCTHFEETFKDSPFFNGTIDLQLIKNFGSQENNYFIADTHGLIDKNILNRLAEANIFDLYIIQMQEDSLKANKIMVKEVEEFFKKTSKMTILLVRNSKKIKLRSKCTDQETNMTTYSENFEIKLERKVKICTVPELSDNDLIADYGRILRDYIYQEINDDEAYSIPKKDDNEKLLEIYNREDKNSILKVINVVKPLIMKLEYAIENEGIKQNDLFAIYPSYFELNQKKYELNKLDCYSNDNQKLNDLKSESTKLKITFENLMKTFTNEHKICTIYEMFTKLLDSDDYVLMINFLIKKLNQILQMELKERQKKKEELMNTLRSNLEAKSTNDSHLTENKINNLNLLIGKKSISIEIIWREMILIYNCLKSSELNRSDYLIVGKRFSDLIFKGQPFEILDGDNFNFNKEFLAGIFKFNQQRIRIISILGPQNSGKSTLLNFMFGCDFTVSDGRCTRGIYGSLIKSNRNDFDYFLILDTEGLQSIEKGDKEYDRKLILFCFAVSNILIINTKDQITDDVKTTLEICVDSLTKIDVVRVDKPSVFFVMNQKADPNRKTDQDAINKIISNFSSNGLISQLKLEENNFETLPSAFNSSILKFNNGKSLVRRFSTSTEFTDRVLQFTNNIINQMSQINSDEAFSIMHKWIDFSNIIFGTINMYPDLTRFKDIAEKTQEKKLQDHLNERIRIKLSNQVRDSMFSEIDNISKSEDAVNRLRTKITRIKQELINDFESYIKFNSVSEMIRRIKKDHLVSQISQIEDSWIQLLEIKKREKDLRRTITSGEGIIKERISYLLKSGEHYSKEQAEEQFNNLFEERSKEIGKNICESINKTDAYFSLIYSTYSSLEKFSLPRKTELEIFLKDFKCDFKTPIRKSGGTCENNINCKQIIEELKTIDKDDFENFYDLCCVNMLKAIDFLQKEKKNLTINELKLNLKHKFSLEWAPLIYLEKGKKDFKICITDLTMTNLPREDINTEQPSQNNHSYVQRVKNVCREIKKNFLQSLKINSSKNFSEDEFSFVVKNFICDRAIVNDAWYLVFDKLKFLKKVDEISKSIDKHQEIDQELVQSIILKLDNLFEEYNKDLKLFELTLTLEPKRHAHVVIFRELVKIYSDKNIQKAENELRIWEQKKDSLSKFFVSQLSPDQNKDSENAKQFLRLFSETLEVDLVKKCKLLINNKLEDKEVQFTRLRMQEKYDSSLTSLSKEKLLAYVLDPTEFLLSDFKILWSSIEENINQEIIVTQSNLAKNFKDLKNCFKQINEHLLQYKKSFETFRASQIFSLAHENAVDESGLKFSRSSSCEINKTGYLKGLCASILLFDFISAHPVKTTYNIENEIFDLDSNINSMFNEIKSNTSQNFKKILDIAKPELSKISIDLIDLFLKNILELIDESSNKFLAKKLTFESLGFNKEKYMTRVRGCETSCPCCGRLCDAEHYKVRTEIGAETNKHKCNRGHQFRGFNGFKLEHSNLPSFKMCEAMKENDHIRYNGKNYKWPEYKVLYPKWDFDSIGNASDWENKCTYIWSLIGEDLCKKFGMTHTSVACDLGPSKSHEAIHFILVLDDSRSMLSNDKWSELIKSVSNFFDIRSKEGSLNDLVSIIYFSVSATTILENSLIYPNLIKELSDPSYGRGTNFSAALNRVIQIIEGNSSNFQKFGVVFMSDGKASYPKQEIELIKAKYLNSIYKFWTIGYGKNENFDVLKQMLRELYGTEKNFRNPTEPIELLNIYVEIAREDNN